MTRYFEQFSPEIVELVRQAATATHMAPIDAEIFLTELFNRALRDGIARMGTDNSGLQRVFILKTGARR